MTDPTPFQYDIAHQWDFAFGDETAARGTHVMVRIAREGKILVEEYMPPEEFLILAHSFENVARGVQAHLDSLKPKHVPERSGIPEPTLPNPSVGLKTGRPVPSLPDPNMGIRTGRRPNSKLDNPIYEK